MRKDVLIIGAGPSGLFAASELARHGVDARLVEREVRPHHEARATTIQPGTLEILDSVGLLQPFLETAEHVHRVRLYDPDMSEVGGLDFKGIDCGCEFQCCLPQYETVRFLEAHLASLGGTIERGVTATKVETDGDDVSVELAHADGDVETVHPDFVIGAGGAHSVTRHSMGELLEGITYQGHFLVADIVMQAPVPRDQGSFFCSPNGIMLLSPLPDGHWLTFQDLEDTVQTVSPEDVVARTEARIGGRSRPTDVAWASPFRMHRRIVPRLADGQRFLIGDAAHLSSPFGGEGLNSGLHDGYDLAWKLALVVHGDAPRSLLDDYAVERAIADRHVLDVSDHVRTGVLGIVDAVREGREPPAGNSDPAAAALARNARVMIDVDYAGSPLVADYEAKGATTTELHPGQRYPDWTRFGGVAHHLLVFGPAADAASLERLDRRWTRLVEVLHDPDVDPTRAGLPTGGIALIRPDGHIGFRSSTTNAEALAALDRHLSSYLVPGSTA